MKPLSEALKDAFEAPTLVMHTSTYPITHIADTQVDLLQGSTLSACIMVACTVGYHGHAGSLLCSGCYLETGINLLSTFCSLSDTVVLGSAGIRMATRSEQDQTTGSSDRCTSESR